MLSWWDSVILFLHLWFSWTCRPLSAFINIRRPLSLGPLLFILRFWGWVLTLRFSQPATLLWLFCWTHFPAGGRFLFRSLRVLLFFRHRCLLILCLRNGGLIRLNKVVVVNRCATCLILLAILILLFCGRRSHCLDILFLLNLIHHFLLNLRQNILLLQTLGELRRVEVLLGWRRFLHHFGWRSGINLILWRVRIGRLAQIGSNGADLQIQRHDFFWDLRTALLDDHIGGLVDVMLYVFDPNVRGFQLTPPGHSHLLLFQWCHFVVGDCWSVLGQFGLQFGPFLRFIYNSFLVILFLQVEQILLLLVWILIFCQLGHRNIDWVQWSALLIWLISLIHFSWRRFPSLFGLTPFLFIDDQRQLVDRLIAYALVFLKRLLRIFYGFYVSPGRDFLATKGLQAIYHFENLQIFLYWILLLRCIHLQTSLGFYFVRELLHAHRMWLTSPGLVHFTFVYFHSAIDFIVDHELDFALNVLIKFLKYKFGTSFETLCYFEINSVVYSFETVVNLYFPSCFFEKWIV